MPERAKRRNRAVLSIRARFEKFHLFVTKGIQHIRRHGGRGVQGACLVWPVLWSYEDARTGLAQVGRRHLAKCLGLSSSQVDAGLALLKQLRFIQVVTPGSAGKVAAVYRLVGLPGDRQERRHDATQDQDLPDAAKTSRH